MPADETKLTIYHPKSKEIGVSARELAAASDPVCKEEEKATELAVRIACEDPTEKDSLADTLPRARRRLKKALGELLRAGVALIFAYLARLFLDRTYKKITEERGEVGRAERGMLALGRLLGSFYIRRLVGRHRLLRALGSARRSDDEGNRIQSLGLAERRYRDGDRFAGADSVGAASDSPIVRVVIGVRITGRARVSEPVWCIKRFVANGRGGWTPIYSGYRAEAQSILFDFYSQPSPAELIQRAEPQESRKPRAAPESPRGMGQLSEAA